ncbi:MAG: ABC transporter ATP-binding protein [Caldilineaceae bacterium]|nr:ABC transporter ATP-binding protein [Caldilineaceae bacterium]
MKLPLRQYAELLAQYLRPQRGRVLILTVLLFSTIGLQLLTPQIVRRFIDTAASGAASATLVTIGLLYLAVTLTTQAVRTGAAYVTEDVKWRATNWLRGDLAEHCLRLDMAFHNEYTPGAMIERIDGDVTELSNFLSQFVIRIAGNAILLTGVLVLLSREDWRLGAAFAGYAALMVLALTSVVNLGVPYWKEYREGMAVMYGQIEEWLGGTEDLVANGGRNYVLDQLRRSIYTLFLATRKAFLIGSMTWGMNSVFAGVSTALALGLGGVFWAAGSITIGTVYLILAYANALQRPLEELARELKDLQSATASIARIKEFMDMEPAVRTQTPATDLPPGALGVEFDQVRFGYEDDDVILNDVSFTLQPGQVLGLLGRTGSGKTTITRLLFRLYDINAGAIRLGDADIRRLPLPVLRSRVGIVTQNVQLFQATVRDNLTFFDPAVSDDRILETLAMLGMDAWLARLPHGLETRLTSGAQSLSAGEAQLLAFARIFLKDPGLVILDEASSRLDPATEQLIERAMDRLLAGRTAIIVAHRLATVQRADRIMILRAGEVAEAGPRVALLADPDSLFSTLMRTGMEKVLA